MDNLSTTQMKPIRLKRTAHASYEGLASTHEDMAFYTVNNIENLLQTAKATDSDDLLKHLDTLKGLRDRMNEFPNPNFHLPDVRFKTIISNSLPRSWRSFVEPYMGNAKNANDPDPKRRIQSNTFIGILREEYKIQRNNERRENGNNGFNGEGSNQTTGSQTNIVNAQTNPRTLRSHISGQTNPRAWCDICEMKGHWTSKCYKHHQNKCYNCGHEGHLARDCKKKNGSWREKNKVKGYKEREKWKGKAKQKEMAEETNIVDEEIVFNTVENSTEGHSASSIDNEEHNFDCYQACNYEANDERLIYYDWVADNATSSHIASEHDSFETYTKIQESTVTGVGGKKAAAIGCGTVTLISNCNGINWTLKLENVLHVPGQKNNLISLGRWDKAGGTYQGGKNKIILITKDGKRVAEGNRLNNFLYGMNVRVKPPTSTSESSQTFTGTESAQSWETWHKRYGHIGYSGLQKLLDNNMVEGLEVDTSTPKPDCVACTEAKQNVEPFPKLTNRNMQTGDLTHIDLWGKYAIRSIHGNQYYIVLVDDAQRYITVEFLKEKNQASQAMINYLTYLKVQGYKPKAIQIDRGREFVNEKLERWCKEEGMELRLTAPYSPPQNGVAERMN